MKICYVDETGTDGESRVVVMVGIAADTHRLRRTQEELNSFLERLKDIPARYVQELKSTQLYRGRGPWKGVDGTVRRGAIDDLCAWVCERKHRLALAAIDVQKFADHQVTDTKKIDIWEAAALHIALQVQCSSQTKQRNKGNAILVFDDNKMKSDRLAELLYDPPDWTDDYYRRRPRQPRLDQIVDTAFFARSHHIGLVQVADIFAFLFRRYVELQEGASDEYYEGERAHISRWVKQLADRLLNPSHRWPKRPPSDCGKLYLELTPESLLPLGSQ